MAHLVRNILQLSGQCFRIGHQHDSKCVALWRCFDYLTMLLSKYYIAKMRWPREDTMKQANILSIETILIVEFDCVILMGKLKIWPF